MTNFSNYFNSKENKNDFFIAVIVIVLCIALGSYILTNNNFEIIGNFDTSIISKNNSNEEIKTKSSITTQVDQKIINAKDIVNWIDSLEHNEIENTSTSIVSDVDTSVVISKNVAKGGVEEINNKPNINLDFNDSDKNEIEIQFADKTNTEPIESQVKSLVVEKEEVIKQVKIEKKQGTKIKNSNAIIKEEAKAKSNCVVILGAFSNSVNLNSLKNKVIKDYSSEEIYLGKRKGYNVIGVHVNCVTAEANLNSLRKKYVEKAWLLKLK